MSSPTRPARPEPEPATTPAEELLVLSERTPPPSQANDALVAGTAIASAVFAVVFAVALLLEAPLPVYGIALALAMLLLAVAVRRYFTDRFPDVEAAEPRLHLDEGDDAPIADVEPVGRRPFLTRILIGAGAVLGLSFAAPVSSLGPSPGNALRTTAWQRGLRVVDGDGEPLRPDDIPVGGVATAWPNGAVGDEPSSLVVLRLSGQPQPPTDLDWVVDGSVVAYSKVCTHAGCPVALYRERDSALFCPCHQSTFDANRGAVPTFGPAARALPQLPLGVDADGYLVALGDFESQVGPAFG
ncbi:MAG: Rieske 2Fe-2S domain-containing protein [Euzebyaceae bacterium]|nr:Rieske 2Fe-2S domain-containing protein [Euzebyaceae bacterium]